jgi:hypothetical protein
LIGASFLVKSLVDFTKHGLGTDVVPVLVFGLGLVLLAVYVARSFKARRQDKDLERFEDLYRLIDSDVPIAAFPDRTVEVLEAQGPAGSNARARRIRELLSCRSAGLIWALAVARRIRPTPALLRAVNAVLAAGPRRPGEPGRFSPESEEPGHVGWSQETAYRTEAAARETLFALQSQVYSHPNPYERGKKRPGDSYR